MIKQLLLNYESEGELLDDLPAILALALEGNENVRMGVKEAFRALYALKANNVDTVEQLNHRLSVSNHSGVWH